MGSSRVQVLRCAVCEVDWEATKLTGANALTAFLITCVKAALLSSWGQFEIDCHRRERPIRCADQQKQKTHATIMVGTQVGDVFVEHSWPPMIT